MAEKIKIRASSPGLLVTRPLRRGADVTYDTPVVVEVDPDGYWLQRWHFGEIEILDTSEAPEVQRAIDSRKATAAAAAAAHAAALAEAERTSSKRRKTAPATKGKE